MYIPYGRQSIDEDDIQAVVNVLRSDFVTTGPKVHEFEQAFAKYVGSKYAVAVSNGTAALHLACLAAGIGPGDEVITTPITFAASANSVLYCGGTVVFADIDPLTYNINPDEIRKKITSHTKAIIPVDYTGQPCALDEIYSIAKEYGLLVIEDASHALGAEYKGAKIGSLSDMTTFSFHPVKHITTGEGGMITTNDDKLFQQLFMLRTHGITRDSSLMHANQGGWYYEQLDLGYNYRLTDIQCALGLNQLKKIDQFIERRREIAEKYNKAFKGLDYIVTPFQALEGNNSWHLYVIQLKGIERKKAYDMLQAAGIGVNVHYIPVYKLPYYQEHGHADTSCPNAEKFYEKIISIPMFPALQESEQDFVINSIIKL